MANNGETMETVRDFILWGSKITTDGDCSHEIKRRLFLGRKAMTNLDSIFKSRHITLPTKVHAAGVGWIPKKEAATTQKAVGQFSNHSSMILTYSKGTV